MRIHRTLAKLPFTIGMDAAMKRKKFIYRKLLYESSSDDPAKGRLLQLIV